MEQEEKQKYLVNEVIKQGYDPDDFQEFLNILQPEKGCNINNWSFDELQQIVKRYKNKFKDDKSEINPPKTIPLIYQKQQKQHENQIQSQQKNVKENLEWGDWQQQINSVSENQFEKQWQFENKNIKEDYKNLNWDQFQETELKQQKLPNNNDFEFKNFRENFNFVKQQHQKQQKTNKKQINLMELYDQNEEIKCDDQQKKIENIIKEDQNQDNIEHKKNIISPEKQYSHLHQDNQEVFDQTLQCKVLNETRVSSHKTGVSIKVESNEERKEGLFSFNKIYYKICTHPFNWAVMRSMADMIWLQQQLIKEFPYNIVPSFLNKKEDSKYIMLNTSFIENFFYLILQSDELVSSEILLNFLNTQDDIGWKNYKKKIDSHQEVTSFEMMRIKDGKIKIEMNEGISSFFNSQNYFTNESEIFYKKLKLLTKRMVKEQNQLQITISDISDCFKELKQKTQVFNQMTLLGKNSRLFETYQIMENMMTKYKQIIQQQTNIFEKNFYYFIRYQQNIIFSFSKVLKKHNNLQKDYSEQQKILLKKKEKIFSSYDISKFEINPQILQSLSNKEELLSNKARAFQLMLPKDSKSLEQLQQKLAFCNSRLYNEICRIINEQVQMFLGNFITFIEQSTMKCVQEQLVWNENLAQLMDQQKK